MRNIYQGFGHALCVWLISCALHAETRTWTDVQGRTVEAAYEGVAAGSVKLRLSNGSVILYQFAKLSEEDQIWVKGAFESTPEKVAERIDQYIDAGLRKANRKPNPETTDEQFVRRAYLDITGAIPSYHQTKQFLKSSNRNKRRELIDQLLDSDEYVSHTFNWYADQLRVISRARDYVVYESYIEWIKQAIKDDMPWDVFVRRLLEAEGDLFTDPASGWYLRDFQRPYHNLNHTTQMFLGVDISCAQCHDHPFEEYTQRDFYTTAAFLAQRRERTGRSSEERKSLKEQIEKVSAEVGGDKRINFLVSFNEQSIWDEAGKTQSLPDTYSYFDAAPGDKVSATTLFGEQVDMLSHDTPRQAFAAWVTSRENERFSTAMVNRIWEMTFGLPLHGPVNNIAKTDNASHPELLRFLSESLVNMSFSLKKLRRAIYYSEAWQREATLTGVPEAEIADNRHLFPGPVLRRMSAEQLWDSCMTLLVTDPYDLKRSADEVRDSFQIDIHSVTGVEATEKADRADRLIDEVISGEAVSLASLPIEAEGHALRPNGDILRDYGDYFVRASEMRQPANADHILRSWGQSDRIGSDNGSTEGNLQQILYIMNGYLSNFVARPDSMIFQKAGEDAKDDKIDQIYLSILNREPTRKEKSIMKKAIVLNPETFHEDLIWALMNSREFLFIQ